MSIARTGYNTNLSFSSMLKDFMQEGVDDQQQTSQFQIPAQPFTLMTLGRFLNSLYLFCMNGMIITVFIS